MANTASSAIPLPVKETADTPHQQDATPETRPALTFSPSTKFVALPATRQRSQGSQNESDDGGSDPDDLPGCQDDKARERMYRDRARDAIKKEQVHMEGFLYKKAGGGASKAWNKRWCVLRSQALLIYKRFSEDKLKRIIRADEIVSVHPVDRRNHSFVFEVETPGRSFLFEASSEQELVSWIGRVRDVVVSFNALNSGGSATTSVRKSSDSCAEPRQSMQQENASDGRSQFATVSKTAASPAREDAESSFLSLPSIGIRRSLSSFRAANSIFAPAEDVGSNGAQAGADRAAGLRTATAPRSPAHLTSDIGDATTALPPGIDPGHEPAPLADDDCAADEEPNFNVDQRREIETRLFEDRVILRGYLLKQDVLRQWRRRWFVLRHNTLSYYHNDREYEVRQIIRRTDIHDIRWPDPSSAKARSLNRTYFKIVTEKRNYWLAHDDCVKAREWFTTLVRWSGGVAVSPVAIRQSVSAQQPSVAVGPAGLPRVFSAASSPQPSSLPHANEPALIANHLGLSVPKHQGSAAVGNQRSNTITRKKTYSHT
ncbi:hypothetical protein IWW45_003391 [Coemansia sp. RSA 485]|nr:hypothetical protein IWW45_003391 [Coemansia sp. RSA 485]